MLRSAARNKVTGYRIAGALRRAAVPMRSLSLLSVLLSVTLLSVSILSATLLSGCAKPVREPKIVTVLDPTEINHLSLEGMVVTAHRDQAISPDSKYLLMGLLGNTSDRMVAVPIDVPGNEDNGAVSLYSADTAWTHNNLLTLMPVGWLSTPNASSSSTAGRTKAQIGVIEARQSTWAMSRQGRRFCLICRCPRARPACR